VKRDGIVVDSAALGIAAPVDPGPHTIEASAPGRKPWSTNVDVGANAAKEAVEVPALAPEASVDKPRPSAPPPAENKPGLLNQRTMALVAGGIGVVGVGIGTVFGLMAMSKWDDAKSGCDPTGCAPDHVDQGHSAETAGNVSTVAFIVGAVG
jgi:hypothetical protein